MKIIYECLQSKWIKWFTAILILVIIISILFEIFYFSKGYFVISAILVTAFLIVVLLSFFFLFPMYIIVDDEGVGIRTLLRTIRIPYEIIDHIERIDEQTPLFGFSKTIRLFGLGRFFGYIGWFRAKGIGTFRSFVTDAKKTFLIYRTKGKPIAISVNEPDKFLPYQNQQQN